MFHRPVVVAERLEPVTIQFSAVPSACKTKCSSFGWSNTIVVLRQCPTRIRSFSEIGPIDGAGSGVTGTWAIRTVAFSKIGPTSDAFAEMSATAITDATMTDMMQTHVVFDVIARPLAQRESGNASISSTGLGFGSIYLQPSTGGHSS